MRVLNGDTDTSVKSISIYLTMSEAKQMLGYLEQLVDDSYNDHFHLNDDSYEHEITLVAYNQSDLTAFDARSKVLIEQDK